MDQNPYQAPTNQPLPGQPQAYSVQQGGGASPHLIDLFRRTKGWVLLIGVLTIIAGVFIILAGILGIAGMGAASSQMAGSSIGGVMVMGGIVYLVMGAVYILAGAKLCGYSSAIGRLLLSGSMADVEAAVEKQRAFWKIAGVLTLIFLILFILGFVFSLVAATAMTNSF